MHNESDFLKQEIIDRVQLKGMCEGPKCYNSSSE